MENNIYVVKYFFKIVYCCQGSAINKMLTIAKGFFKYVNHCQAYSVTTWITVKTFLPSVLVKTILVLVNPGQYSFMSLVITFKAIR